MAGKGGYQAPARPAAVSGSGAASQRTDGGPGDKVAARTPTGGAYGQAKALGQQQQAAPMGSGRQGAGGAPASGAAGPTAPPGVAPQGAFGPTQRPAEANTAGAMTGDPVMENADAALRVLYSKFPHPNIEAMMKKRADPR